MGFRNIFSRNNADIERRKPLPWIADPTISEQDDLLPDPSGPGFEAHPKSGDPSSGDSKGGKRSSGFPGFKRLDAPNPIELFYELFLVANLSGFMEVQSISNAASLKSYVGYISLLWFTWLQTTLFDVRYDTDSIISRLFRILQIGLMLGFSIMGPNFNFDETQEHPNLLRDVSLVLMATRLVLAFQYGTVAWYVRGYKETFLAILVPIITLFGAAMAYLGIAFAFNNSTNSRAYIGWYTVVGVEAAVMLIGPMFHKLRDLSFSNTMIADRFNDLTLVVLGEAVVGMTKAATSIAQGTADITKSSVGLLISYIMTVYFMYVIYFDQLDDTRFKAAHRQIWAILHFPLHIAMLLTIDASRAFVLWDTSRSLIQRVGTEIAFAYYSYDENDLSTLIDGLKEGIAIFAEQLATDDNMPDFQPLYDQINNLTSSEQDLLKVPDIIESFQEKLILWVFGSLNLFSSVADQDRDMDEILSDFELQASYQFPSLFIAAGCTLVSLAMLHWFGKPQKTRGEMVSIVTTTVIGIALALVSRILTPEHMDGVGKDFGTQLLFTPWLQPTILLTFALVVAIDSFIIWFSYRRYYKPIA